MGIYTKRQLLLLAKKEEVKYIRLQFTDMLGSIKAVEIPVGKLEDALNNKIMFDGSSIEGFVRIKEADMYLRPDLDSWLILTFEDSKYGKVARLICDIYTPYNKPFQGDPRFILKKAIKKASEFGIDKINIGFEPEFYIFKLDENDKPIMSPSDSGGYFDLAPLDGANYVRRDIALELEHLGFVVQTAHHEVGNGQHEVTFQYSDVLSACDAVQTFKQVVKSISRKHGYYASFMPKPIEGLAGSGMHCNVSLATNEGTNLFYDKSNTMKLSFLCRQFITGVLKHSRSLSALTNPCINSYKRLMPGYEAPCYACWGDANRSSMIRIPAIRSNNATRIELRNVDPTTNPYLSLAAIIECGIEGIKTIKTEDETIKPINDNLFQLSEAQRLQKGIVSLPNTLDEALQAMQSDELMFTVLGEHTYNKYLTAKKLEIESYRRSISDWEVKRYL